MAFIFRVEIAPNVFGTLTLDTEDQAEPVTPGMKGITTFERDLLAEVMVRQPGIWGNSISLGQISAEEMLHFFSQNTVVTGILIEGSVEDYTRDLDDGDVT